jgi:hypothetical protein
MELFLMAKTSAERQAKYRSRAHARGLVQANVMIPEGKHYRDRLIKFAAKLRREFDKSSKAD